jgi:hypothetical protein
MKLLPAPPSHFTHMFHRLVSENNYVHMGLMRVAYGYRVRAGWCLDRAGVHLDWCGGGNWLDAQNLYSCLANILSKRPEDHDCFANLPPHSEVKPYFLDTDFLLKVGAVIELPIQPFVLQQPSLDEILSFTQEGKDLNLTMLGHEELLAKSSPNQ